MSTARQSRAAVSVRQVFALKESDLAEVVSAESGIDFSLGSLIYRPGMKAVCLHEEGSRN